ncbi:hypothetical protein [Lactococcus lactis]|uniref:Uncharacterized protein n=1 Tax=Lactococcus lactis TaxID=1358 RepID=A0A6M0MC94_9LACT|nr:hypothetical protein [Lactococcus lactis]NEX51469.1 hypothetical protein [Lactococcus lactis]NEX56805.1 hypothetical protein [Lactococcus lactis]
MSDKKCPNCGYQIDSWNDCVSVNNILECPECEEHFELKAVALNKPQLTIPKSIADELDEEIEEAYSNDYIRSYSDVGAYMEAITDGLDEDSELYKFMFPDNDALLGCSHRNIIYLYLVDNDLVKVVEG